MKVKQMLKDYKNYVTEIALVSILALFAVSSCIPGCQLLDTGNEDHKILLRVLVAEAIYQGNQPGSDEVCQNADKALYIAGDVRSMFADQVVPMSALEENLRSILLDKEVNPVTTEAVLGLAARIVDKYVNMKLSDPKIAELSTTLNDLADIAISIAESAKNGCS